MATDLVAFKPVSHGVLATTSLDALRQHVSKKQRVRDEEGGGFSLRPKGCLHRVYMSSEVASVGKPTDLLIYRARAQMGPVAKLFVIGATILLTPTVLGLFIIPTSLAESRKLCRKAFDELTAKALLSIA